MERESVPCLPSCFLTFSLDSTLSGYAITANSFALITFAGTWSYDSRGRILGSFSEHVNGQSYNFNFLGTVKKGAKLQMSAVGANGSLKLKGIRAVALANLTGRYIGEVKEKDQTFTEVYDLNPGNYPGLFNMSGSTSLGSDISGALIISSRNLVNAFYVTDIGAQGTLLKGLSGKIDPAKIVSKLKGFDKTGARFSTTITKQ